jgi:HD domain
MQHTTHKPALVADPGRPQTGTLIRRVLSAEIRGGLRRLMHTLGLPRLNTITPEDWAIPDSEFAQQAITYATHLCDPVVIRHCFRSYCFGVQLAARHNLMIDREVFFVASMLHDLGLCDTHANDPGSFEWVGAKLAHDFCIYQEQSEYVAAMVHNAIALHTSVGIADQHAPEVAMLHVGTGMDLLGMRINEIPQEYILDVLAQFPRDNVKQTFSHCLHHQAKQKPCSHIAGAVGLGITNRIRELNQ